MGDGEVCWVGFAVDNIITRRKNLMQSNLRSKVASSFLVMLLVSIALVSCASTTNVEHVTYYQGVHHE